MATRLTDREIDEIARRIAADIAGSAVPVVPSTPPQGLGIFATVGEAVRAATVAQPLFAAVPLAQRARILEAMRQAMRDNNEALAKAAHDETGLGRYEDKIVKNSLVTERTPGLEDLSPIATTGDHGLTLIEPAPFGVIGAITPVTNPTSTIICNSIGMLAAGNAVVFNVHPYAKNCCMQTIALLNKAIVGAGGPPNVITGVASPTIESAQELMKDPGVRLVVVTGGGEVVRAAMNSGKRAICAGPGNPPVAVDSITDALIASMGRQGAVVIPRERLPQLERVVFTEMKGPRQRAKVDKDLIGKNASVILSRMGMSVPDSVRLIVAEVDENHPLIWTEQMMPVMPVTRVSNANRAIDLAVEAEAGNRHTAVMHSKNLDNLSRMAKACNCSIFVKNGRSQAGLGLDGEGYCSFTIASPTGEGMTSPRSFSRWRRCVLVDHFRIT